MTLIVKDANKLEISWNLFLLDNVKASYKKGLPLISIWSTKSFGIFVKNPQRSPMNSLLSLDTDISLIEASKAAFTSNADGPAGNWDENH